MDEQLQQVRGWVRRGTLRQFYTDMSGKIATQGYVAEINEATIRCYRVTRERKFPAVKWRETKTLVLTISQQEKQVNFSDADPDFVGLLARLAGKTSSQPAVATPSKGRGSG